MPGLHGFVNSLSALPLTSRVVDPRTSPQGGDLTVDSEGIGKGARFTATFNLPQAGPPQPLPEPGSSMRAATAALFAATAGGLAPAAAVRGPARPASAALIIAADPNAAAVAPAGAQQPSFALPASTASKRGLSFLANGLTTLLQPKRPSSNVGGGAASTASSESTGRRGSRGVSDNGPGGDAAAAVAAVPGPSRKSCAPTPFPSYFPPPSPPASVRRICKHIPAE